MRRKNSISLQALWDQIRTLDETNSEELADYFGCSRGSILNACHDLEEIHEGELAIDNLGIRICIGKNKTAGERFLHAGKHSESIINRRRHVAKHFLEPAQKRIGRAILIKLMPERKLLAIESNIDYLAELRKAQEKDIIATFDFDEKAKMTRSVSTGRGP